MSNVPLVSVWMVTYNHQDYIAQAVESVMMQRTDFNFHLFIGEDFSSDNTRVICQLLKQKYPDRISLVLNDKNFGAYKNAGNIYQACFNSRAKYIAMLEGDDYWTDPLKLQKQVNFLEKNSKYSGCFHNTQVVNEMARNPQIKSWRAYTKIDFTLKDTISAASLFHTSSFMFRAVVISIPIWFYEVQSTDMALFSLVALKGPIFRLDDFMSVYRKNTNGITSFIKPIDLHRNRILLWESFIKNCPPDSLFKIEEVINFHRKELEKIENYNKSFLHKIFKKLAI